MEIMHEKLGFNGDSSFSVKWDDFPHFTFPWHFHPEFELVYVIKSFGKRFVGDHVEDFYDGDLVLLGPNLPHFWKNDELFYRNDPEYKVNAIVVHFSEGLFIQHPENYPEFHHIRKLLKRASRGISFPREVADPLGPGLQKLLKQKGLNRLLSFIRILDKLAGAKEYRLLASENASAEMYDWSGSRLDKILHLVNMNYRMPLKLEDVAEQIGMNPTAFCRYFKGKTGKSFIGFVNEMRVGYACRLLQEGKQSVSQICFESGFNNLSNFNRCFKKLTSFTPVHYRNQFTEQNS